jgi:ubiquinone/menaquinone biosynthesis C-methylase UbiE
MMAQRTWSKPNEEAILAWNTVLFDKFVRFREVLLRGGAAHSDVALARHPPAMGARVVDLGCGFGDTTLEIARRIGPRGSVVGVDASHRFVEAAREEARRSSRVNATFRTGDVQTAPLEGPFDMAFSRFGTMFFASPVAALRNVRRALVDGGKLCMIVWRRREDNAFLHVAESIVRIAAGTIESNGEPTCGPGPFSMAGPDTTSDILHAAGFRDVTFERCDLPMFIGRNVDEAIDLALELGPAGEMLRLAGEHRDRLTPQVLPRLREALSELAGAGGVFASSSTWIVTALAR